MNQPNLLHFLFLRDTTRKAVSITFTLFFCWIDRASVSLLALNDNGNYLIGLARGEEGISSDYQ